MNPQAKLSPHFALSELLITAHRYLDNSPSPEVIDRLRELCMEYLEPVRTAFGPVIVTSGYRCPQLNLAIGGSKTSAHMYGCAADFFALHGASCQRVVEWVGMDSRVPYDQIIDEYSSTSNWVHLAMVRPVGSQIPRRQSLTMRDGKYSVFV